MVFSTQVTDVSPEQRFSGTLTLTEFQRLFSSCHHFWTQVSNLTNFQNSSVSKALKGEDKFLETNPIRPMAFAATTQISLVTLLLSVYRVLGERLKVLGASVQTRAAGARQGLGHPPTLEEMEVLKQLKLLFEHCKTLTVSAARRIAHLTAWLLPRHVFK